MSDVLRFTNAAQTLARAARARGLPIIPAFRSPPRSPTEQRSITRYHDGERIGAVVAVRLRDRPWDDVLADMVAGLIEANGWSEPADRAALAAEILAEVSAEIRS